MSKNSRDLYLNVMLKSASLAADHYFELLRLYYPEVINMTPFSAMFLKRLLILIYLEGLQNCLTNNDLYDMCSNDFESNRLELHLTIFKKDTKNNEI